MIKRFSLMLMLFGLVIGQSSWDVLTLPSDSRDAALGINMNPLVRPAELAGETQVEITLSGWNWIEDIQGAHLGVELDRSYLGVTAVNFGEIEYRGDVPSEEPISTFSYSIFSLGGAYALEWNQIMLGAAAEFLYERTLDTSSTGLSVNLSGAYPLSDQIKVSGGLRHLGYLSSASADLPTEAWLGADMSMDNLGVTAEFNTGSFPFALGASYEFAGVFDVIGGVQMENAEPSIRLHPSIGFTASWTNFRLGYTNYQLSHKLGSRHFLSLYWRY